ncbi:DUF4402 domain-containing protein [Caulobacter sp. 17J80-11]|uniref:DUF4402 domain-containing protein n=1 Tax=Caulobacter sp. 17J80-11 TaxID=2763502 RepID=UPI0016539592|nr:DUF4402 domain-containing protein [Caulobacter sp. 17J80-11]MBC6981957.1 DUF4402 domain-containing protein [Caulobacter sp. 17J80-11]
MTRAHLSPALRAGTLILAAALVSTSAASAPAKQGAARMTLLQPLTLTYDSDLAFGRLHTDNGHGSGTVTVKPGPTPTRTAVNAHITPGGAFGPAITTVRGEPGRLYRVTLPSGVKAAPGAHPVGAFTVWSALRGDVTTSGVGQIGPDGKDTIRIGGTVTLPPGTKVQIFHAEPAITVSYE